jgi:hypothetical protein
VAESPVAAGAVWAGTDDGRVQVTRDGGRSWSDRTDALEAVGAPEAYWVTRVVPSPHDAATAFVTITGFHRDDFRPFVFRTDDYGATWRSLSDDLPGRAPANVLVQDRENADLLFLGTDHGLFASVDGGASWAPFQADMPVVPVRALVIHPRENDLVVGTHGRGAFVTDITPLQQLGPGVLADDVHLFAPEPKGPRVESGWGNYRLFGWRHVTTPNEPNGVLLDVWQRRPGADTLSLVIRDASGAVVRTLEEPGGAGLHRVVWDLRTGNRRPVPAGTYEVTLEAGAERSTRTLTVKQPVVLPRG